MDDGIAYTIVSIRHILASGNGGLDPAYRIYRVRSAPAGRFRRRMASSRHSALTAMRRKKIDQMPSKRSTAYRLLARAELPADTISLARNLIGKILVRETPAGSVSGRIVETEAYPVGDPAGHGYRGMTARNRSLFLSRGHAYVYFIYGRSYLLNVASEKTGVGAGVLIRALEPMEGVPIMARNRGAGNLYELGRGPGRLTVALQIDRRLDGTDLCRKGPLWLARDNCRVEIGRSVRIGVSRGAEFLRRFYVRGSRFVSGPRTLNR